MELLEERIRRDGVVKSEGVLKVDGFLNHRVDCQFMAELADEYMLFLYVETIRLCTADANGNEYA